MKYQAPKGISGISVGGEQFNVDENGQIEVPEGEYHVLLAPHGFTPVATEGKTAKATSKQAKAAAEPVATEGKTE